MEDTLSKYCSECKSKDGKFKRLYQSFDEAEEAGYKLTKNKGVYHRAYACVVGNGWHITSRYPTMEELSIYKKQKTMAHELRISIPQLIKAELENTENNLKAACPGNSSDPVKNSDINYSGWVRKSKRIK